MVDYMVASCIKLQSKERITKVRGESQYFPDKPNFVHCVEINMQRAWDSDELLSLIKGGRATPALVRLDWFCVLYESLICDILLNIQKGRVASGE